MGQRKVVPRGKEITEVGSPPVGVQEDTMSRLTEQFAVYNRLIMRDLNNPTRTSFFSKYTKDDIKNFLNTPENSAKQLRQAVQYLYGASSHFRRLIQYFVGLSPWNTVPTVALPHAPTTMNPTLAKCIRYAMPAEIVNSLNFLSG